MNVLRDAVEAAQRNNIPIVVVASTTGNTAAEFLGLIKPEKMKVIVVTHDEGRPIEKRRFNEDIRRQLLAHNITVYTHNSTRSLWPKIISKLRAKFGFSSWQKYLQEVKGKYGTGIKVCHIMVKMLIEARLLSDDRVVAIAGTKSGADSAGIFWVKPKNKWPILEKVIVSPA